MRALAFAASALALVLSAPAARAGGPASAHYARGSKSLFWFMHLSDPHIGSPQLLGPNATAHLQAALGDITTVIHPVFVAMSGDLSDGSVGGIPYAGQDPAVWATYEQTYTQASMTPAFYFDQPGNHDGYADVGLHSYLGHSLQGKTTGKLFTSWTYTSALGGQYIFFGLNSAGQGQTFPPEKPEFTADELTFLESSLAASPDAELALVFAHHPIDGAPGGDSVAQLLENYGGAFYLHGHEHLYNEKIVSTPFVVSNQVGSLGQNDTDNVAVGVVDHNAFIYRATDVVAPWPLIIITAPVSHTLRDSEVPNPWAYEVCKDRVDNPVRALVFAADAPSAVTVTVGSVPSVGMAAVAATPPLYQTVVDTSTLPVGDFDVVVTATIGGTDYSETISSHFTAGPCDPLPDDDAIPDAGTGGSGAGGSGGQAGTGGPGGSGTGAAAPVAPLNPTANSGCGCRMAGADSPGRTSALGLPTALLCALGLASRRRARRPRRTTR